MATTLNVCVAFQVATDADGISTLRIKLGRVNDSCVAFARNMLARITMAAFTGNTATKERPGLRVVF
jgi:hypothetical protein